MSNYKDLKHKNISDAGTEGTKVASGTTAQRGSTAGQFRFNSTTGLAEYSDGTQFKSIDVNPTVSSVDVTEVDSGAGGNQTIVITGTNFLTGAIANFVGSSASFNATSTTVDSATQITAVAPKSSFLNAQEPYGIKVTNLQSGLSATLTGQINVDSAPTWVTASGNIADIGESDTGTHVTVVASDAEGDTIAYTETGGTVLSGQNLTLNSATGAISGDPTDVGANTTHSFTLRATAGGKTADRAFNIIVRDTFVGGAQAAATMEALAKKILYAANGNVTLGGALTLNSNALGNYEYYKTSGATTISSFTESNYFSSTEDTLGSFLVFNGNLTLNAGQTIQPVKRKLYTVMYVNGNLVVNGDIKMTARGANHSGTGSSGGATTTQAIPMISGTYSSVTDATILATGGAGGAAKTGGTGDGYVGGTATRGSGGGGSGGNGDGNYTSGAGAVGTAFSGGSGGGGSDNGSATNATANGGAGGNSGGNNAGGGAGNPQGSNAGMHSPQNPGTGGTLIIFCTGTLSGSGNINADSTDGGVIGGSASFRGGGSAGGGLVQIFCNSGTVTTSAHGGFETNTNGQNGMPGGAGATDIYTGYTG